MLSRKAPTVPLLLQLRWVHEALWVTPYTLSYMWQARAGGWSVRNFFLLGWSRLGPPAPFLTSMM